jgi:porin
LANKGVQFEVDTFHIFQHVTDPGKRRTGRYGGSADYTLKIDTNKLGLWPGGFLKIHAETNFGNSVNADAGGLSPVNGDALFPGLGHNRTAVSNLTFLQFLAPWVGVMLGKIEGYDADANEFADDHRTKFLNIGFDLNLVNGLAPLSALGAGIVLVPSKDAVFTLSVLDPNGVPTESGFNNFFKDGVMVGGEGRVTIRPFGLTGHQLLGATWSNKERLSLLQDPTNIARLLLQSRFPRLQDPGPILLRILQLFFPGGVPGPVKPLNREQDTWSVYYNFDQYLWSPANDPNRGVGVFFRFGVADGHTNPVKYQYSFGIGGKGALPGRERDTFGIGWSRLVLNDNLVPFLRDRLKLGLKHDDTVELFYNFAVTGWLSLTADLQVIEPGLKKKLVDGRLEKMNTAVVTGLRVKVAF